MAYYAPVLESCGIPECQRPCYVRNGITHGFCGRTHAAEAVSRGMLDTLRPPHGICHRCQLNGCAKEAYFDESTGRVHDFCSRRHADIAMARGEWPLDQMRGSSECRLRGCEDFVYRDPHTGVESEYCCRDHLDRGQEEEEEEEEEERVPSCCRCIRPAWLDPETGGNLSFCSGRCAFAAGKNYLTGSSQCSLPGCVQLTMLHPSTSRDLGYCCAEHQRRALDRQLGPNTEPFVDRTFRGGTTSDTDFKLSVLTNSHPKYASIKDQFFTKWQKPVNGLVVERIFKVQVPADILDAHNEYATTVGNVCRRFHGTSCSDMCRFFVDLRGGPCGHPECSVCSICTHGFKIEGFNGRTAQNTNFPLRYGRGLYFSSVSGKANDYAVASEKAGPRGKRWRCMFMASVAVGNAYQTKEGFLRDDMCPPYGYDSVVGQVGQELNHDEVAVYADEAALPTYLIVYSNHR